MADKKISQLSSASTPVAGTEVLPIVQGGSTLKVSIANLTAGRATGALSFTSTSAGSDTAQLLGTGLTVTHAGGSTSFATFNQFPGWGGSLVLSSSATEFGLNSSLPFAIRNSAGAEIAKFAPTASAVNEVTITSAATGGAPSIAATGDDTNILLRLNPKGTGYVDVQKSAAAGVVEGLRLTNPQNAGTTGDGVSIRFQNTPDPGQNRHARIESYSADTFGQSAGLRFLINNASDAPRTVLDLPGGTSGNVRVSEGNLVVGTAGKGIADANGNESLLFSATASAVNEFTITNAASGDSPTFSATGAGTDLDVRLLPKGTGDVRALNKLRITSSAGDTNARLATKLTSVSTGATDISPIGNTWGNLCIVTGLDAGGQFFTDLVFTAATAGPTVLSAKTVSGSPAARTYTMSGSDILQVAMASGTYNIHCAVFSGLN